MNMEQKNLKVDCHYFEPQEEGEGPPKYDGVLSIYDSKGNKFSIIAFDMFDYRGEEYDNIDETKASWACIEYDFISSFPMLSELISKWMKDDDGKTFKEKEEKSEEIFYKEVGTMKRELISVLDHLSYELGKLEIEL